MLFLHVEKLVATHERKFFADRIVVHFIFIFYEEMFISYSVICCLLRNQNLSLIINQCVTFGHRQQLRRLPLQRRLPHQQLHQPL